MIGAAVPALLTAPVALAGLVQAYIFYARPDLHWVGLAWRTRAVPVYLSFAFWEWLTIAFLTLYLLVFSATDRWVLGQTDRGWHRSRSAGADSVVYPHG